MIKEDRRYRSLLPFPGLKGDFSLLSTDRINKDNCFATGLWPGRLFLTISSFTFCRSRPSPRSIQPSDRLDGLILWQL